MNDNLQQLRKKGQSLWLDNITRQMLDDGTLERWIGEYGLTGLTSNPSIFDEAIGGSDAYDAGIDDGALAAQLQEEGADAFVKSWKQLLDRIEDKAGKVGG